MRINLTGFIKDANKKSSVIWHEIFGSRSTIKGDITRFLKLILAKSSYIIHKFPVKVHIRFKIYVASCNVWNLYLANLYKSIIQNLIFAYIFTLRFDVKESSSLLQKAIMKLTASQILKFKFPSVSVGLILCSTLKFCMMLKIIVGIFAVIDVNDDIL